MTNKHPRISVVIPTFNSWQTLKDCINSISKQSLKPAEIIIVDNSSVDNTSVNVKRLFPKVKLITLSTNTGVTGGRNTGIKSVNKSSEYIFLFDHDMVADKRMLEELVKVARTQVAVGMVTPKIYYFDDEKIIWSAGTGINLWTGQVLFRGGRDESQYQKVEPVQIAPAAMLVGAAVIKKVGLFDNKYFATYEDTDYSLRVAKAGFGVWYAPYAVAYHKIPLDKESESLRLLSRLYYIGRNRVLFMRDYGTNYPVFLCFIPVFIAYYFILSIKMRKLNRWLDFLRGTWDGLLN